MIVAEPLAVPVQDASEIDVTVYVLLVVGLTVKVYGLELIPFTVTGVVPSVYVKFHGAVPVSAILIALDSPSQIEAEPEMVAPAAQG